MGIGGRYSIATRLKFTLPLIAAGYKRAKLYSHPVHGANDCCEDTPLMDQNQTQMGFWWVDIRSRRNRWILEEIGRIHVSPGVREALYSEMKRWWILDTCMIHICLRLATDNI